MKKAIVAAFTLGVVIAIFHGIIELGTIDWVALTGPSSAIVLPPLIAGLVAGIVVMAGTRSRLKGLVLVLVAVFIGALVGHFIGFQIALGEIGSKLGLIGAAAVAHITARTGEFVGAALVDSAANLIVAFIPAVVGVVVGKKLFRPK